MTKWIYITWVGLMCLIVFTPIDWSQGAGATMLLVWLLMVPVVVGAFFIDLARLADRLLGH